MEFDTQINIRVQKRNGRKTITTLEGLSDQYDKEKMIKVLKKTWGCNGTIINDPKLGNILQLQGDQRIKLKEFLISERVADSSQIWIHGF